MYILCFYLIFCWIFLTLLFIWCYAFQTNLFWFDIFFFNLRIFLFFSRFGTILLMKILDINFLCNFFSFFWTFFLLTLWLNSQFISVISFCSLVLYQKRSLVHTSFHIFRNILKNNAIDIEVLLSFRNHHRILEIRLYKFIIKLVVP